MQVTRTSKSSQHAQEYVEAQCECERAHALSISIHILCDACKRLQYFTNEITKVHKIALAQLFVLHCISVGESQVIKLTVHQWDKTAKRTQRAADQLRLAYGCQRLADLSDGDDFCGKLSKLLLPAGLVCDSHRLPSRLRCKYRFFIGKRQS